MSNYPKGRKSKHGYSTRTRTIPEYWVWTHMRSRTTRLSDPEYKNYGARGITVCAEWQEFSQFFKDMGPRPTGKHTLERIDNSKGYSPDNCRWATQAEQNRNNRRTRVITWKGKTQCVSDWAAELKVKTHSLQTRFRRGWTVERAMTTPF